MPSSQFVAKALSVPLFILSMTLTATAQTADQAEQPAVKQDAGEQHATEHLRAIAEAIRRCPGYQSAYHSGIATYFLRSDECRLGR